MGLKLHVGDNILKFHALYAHIWPRTRCQIINDLSVVFVSGALNLDPKTYPNTTCTQCTLYTVHFECMESGPNDSTRVHPLTSILRRARVKIFILAYGSFWSQLSDFLSNLTGHHETKTAKRIWSCRSKYWNFYTKPRLPTVRDNLFRICQISVSTPHFSRK
jgi:hypothetical protein